MALTALPVENSVYTVENGVIKSQLGMHLDMRDTDDHYDLSGSSVTVGQSGTAFLTWIKPTQIGSSGHQLYPGIFGGSSGGNYSDFTTLRSTDGATHTSGTPDTQIRIETSENDEVGVSNSYAMSIGEWHVIGYNLNDDGSVDYFFDDVTRGESSTMATSTETQNINYPGYGYGDATDGGSGGKYLDSTMVFSRTVTASEVSDFYNNGTVPDNADHHWKYDDNSDTTTIIDSIGTADGSNSGCTYVDGNAY